MRLLDFVGSQMPDAKQLPKMLRNGRVGASLRELEVAPVDSRELRRLVRLYANGPEGPFGKKRMELYCEVRELFHLLAGEAGNEELCPYELKDSFIGGEEANLIMLVSSHEGKSQEELAYNVLGCSKNAVGDRRALMRDGIRIGGMCIQADFGYRGSFESSVHPASLPLNLSEVYVLLDALKSYEVARERHDPHRELCERVSGMVHAQLSEYARKILDPRLEHAGYRFRDEEPIFCGDGSQSAQWIMFEKRRDLVEVELDDGSVFVGRIQLLPRQKDVCPQITVISDDGSVKSAAWGRVVDIRLAGARQQ